jgi:hypothetical protein
MRAAYSGIGQRIRDPATGFIVGGTEPTECGRRFCIGCGRWRPLVDFEWVERRGWRGWRARCCACRRIEERARYANRSLQERERRREYERIYLEVQRRQQGIPPRTYHNHTTVVDHIERVFLAREPLATCLRTYLAATFPGKSVEGGGLRGLASRYPGLHERTMDRILTGESKHVRLDVADRIAVAIGVPLAVMYPEDQS